MGLAIVWLNGGLQRYVHVLIYRTYDYSSLWPKIRFIKNFKRRSLSLTFQVDSNSNEKCPRKIEAKGDLKNRGEVM